MVVIAVLNQKGGVGKTTIATHLARALQKLHGDHSVLLVDSDPQGSARDWAAVKDDNPLPVVGIDRPTLERDLKALTSKAYVVIDGAPRTSDMAASAIRAADFILIPVQPSPYDIWATAELVNLVKGRMEITRGTVRELKAAFVVSRAIKGTRIGAEVTAALDGYGLPVLSHRIMQRVAYPGSAALGSTVLDLQPVSEASMEMIGLAAEVKEMLK